VAPPRRIIATRKGKLNKVRAGEMIIQGTAAAKKSTSKKRAPTRSVTP
jgi:hypothetical protein